MSNVILTHSGRYFDFNAPETAVYDIKDIAHALSRLCRYTGHCRGFYSVAQHSVYVSYNVPEHLALEGLLHDASEAYLGDVSSPLKALLPDYNAIEKRVESAIAAHFKLEWPFAEAVRQADMRMLVTEKRDIMPVALDTSVAWPSYKPYGWRVKPYSTFKAEQMFLDRYEMLIKERQ